MIRVDIHGNRYMSENKYQKFLDRIEKYIDEEGKKAKPNIHKLSSFKRLVKFMVRYEKRKYNF